MGSIEPPAHKTDEGGGRRWARAALAPPRVAGHPRAGIFGALFYFWQQADAFWEYVWAVFPKAILWPAFMVYEGFRALGA